MSVRKTIGVVVGAVAALAIATPASASTGLDPGALDKAIAIQPGDNLAGVIALAGENGRTWLGSTADAVTGRPIKPNSEFRIGSISKTFEATVAVQLAADHVLDLDRSVQSYVPGMLPRRYAPITIRELLNMTSGLPDVDEGAPAPTADEQIAGRFHYQTLDQIIQGSLRPRGRPWPTAHFAPGTKQLYDSLSYRIVADVIERRTGESFGAVVYQRIIRPLHLTGTYSADFITPMPNPYLHGYVAADDGTLVDVSEQAGDASSMISTPRDIDTFFSALFDGKLLPDKQLHDMLTVPAVPYADSSNCFAGKYPGQACFGLGVEELQLSDGMTLWGKSGHDLGYGSAYFRTLDPTGPRLLYSVAQTDLTGEMPPTALRLAAALGIRLQ